MRQKKAEIDAMKYIANFGLLNVLSFFIPAPAYKDGHTIYF
jgi:hypothetical protein